MSKDLKNYKRVGDSYYENIQKPFLSPSGNLIHEEHLTPRLKQTMIDDHGKTAPAHVERYKDFVNIADHLNYQPVVSNCLNLYHELNHQPEEGKFKHIEMLLKHIFQDKYEMILDYITILYRYPLQKLPVVCLVSKTQKTGKSTFVFLMKLIFQNNMIGISNKGFSEDFNDHWITKLVVACEETMFDKKDAYEKLKDLTTNPYINRKEKNKSAVAISNMLHFIFCSNHEDDFVKIDKNDSRLWITKVTGRPKKIDDFEDKLESEVNSFVYFLMNREITHQKISRLWFDEELFRTDAFYNVVKNSEPSIIKDIREQLTELFLVTGVEEIKMSVKDIKNEFSIRQEINYVNKMVNEYLKPTIELDKKGNRKVSTYTYVIPDPSEPKNILEKKGKGRYFVFKKEDY
ncbi:MAG: DUF5906 domain-containing protein [Crocinitomicaceae bacterium]|nr:DUF5906 domain-containing protein [Crocinitomicaceae bacterium]